MYYLVGIIRGEQLGHNIIIVPQDEHIVLQQLTIITLTVGFFFRNLKYLHNLMIVRMYASLSPFT